jgi:lipopolysaccharide transport system permease protein
LVQFGVQLLMYATPIIYPISTIPDKFKIYILLNPLSHIVETFKLAFLGKGEFLVGSMIYSLCFTLVILLIGILIFNKTERSFMDTV